MKRLPPGLILFDTIDIICLSFSVDSGLLYLIRKHNERKNIDPIVMELKKKSLIITVSVDSKPLKLTVMRSGEKFKRVSLSIKSKILAALIRVIVNAKRRQKQLKLLQIILAILNASLTSTVGLWFSASNYLDYTQFTLIIIPATIGGFLMKQLFENPLTSVLLPLVIFYGRRIEDVTNPSEKYKILCKAAEEFHNK